MAAPGDGSWVVLAIHPNFLIPTLALVGALLIGALVIALVRRWQRDDEPSLDAAEEMARYHALYEQGAISEKEYHSLRAVLGGQLRQSIQLHAQAPETGPVLLKECPTEVQPPPGAPQGSDVPNTPPDGVRAAQ